MDLAEYRRGRPHRLLLLAAAGWMRFLRGCDHVGNEVPVSSPMADRLVEPPRTGRQEPEPPVRERSVVGALGEDGAFVAGSRWRCGR